MRTDTVVKVSVDVQEHLVDAIREASESYNLDVVEALEQALCLIQDYTEWDAPGTSFNDHANSAILVVGHRSVIE